MLKGYNLTMSIFKRTKKKNKTDIATNAQLERIEVLKAEINRLNGELESYSRNSEKTLEVLAFAKERAEEYESEARIRFQLENERLISYRNKWSKRLKALGDAEKLGEEVIECHEFFKDCIEDLTAIVEGRPLKKDSPKESYYRECVRLEELGVAEAPEKRLTEEELNKLLMQFSGV